MSGQVLNIFIANKGEAPKAQARVTVEAHKGIVGDRYYNGSGTFSEKLAGNRKSEITFIAAEEVDRFNAATGLSLDYGAPRRNVITSGIELGSLVGREFSIGNARFRGIELCEPCAHLAETVHPEVVPHLVHTGLRAAILESGTLENGSPITQEA